MKEFGGYCMLILSTLILSCAVPGSMTRDSLEMEKQLIAHWSFEGCNAQDQSGNGFHGVPGGDPECEAGIAGRSFSFDGRDDFIDIPDSTDISFSDQITISALVWIRKFPDRANMQVIQKNDPRGGPGNHTFSFTLLGNPGSYYGGCCSPYSFGIEMNLDGRMMSGMWSKNKLKERNWYHLAATYDGSEVRLYLNGKPDSSFPRSGKIAINKAPIGIGSYHKSNVDFFNGRIDEVRIYDRALGDSEVARLHKSF